MCMITRDFSVILMTSQASLSLSLLLLLLLLLGKTTLLTLHKGDTYTDTEKHKEIHKEVNKRKEEEEPEEVEVGGERD